MTDASLTYFGIDLGTTYSVVAYMDETGRPAVVRGAMDSKETVPSVVYFENADNVVVGAQAKNVAMVYPDRVVQRVKRSMGQERYWEFDGRTYTPEAISALILKQLAQDAATYTRQDVHDVVITVPAYFGMLERDATANAGRIAGLDVIGIVPEPVAAALQYDVAGAGGERTVLVYDLGGGTFDTTVIRISPEAVQVVCTDGDQELGGVDWDDRLIDHLVEEFVAAARPGEDPRDDAEFMQELRDKAEDLKRQLSEATSRRVPLRFAGASAMPEVTRDAFERVTKDLLDSTLRYTDRTLEKMAAKLGVPDPARAIDDVLLVGGSSKMPAVSAALAAKYGWAPLLHDPDLSVAKGAARFALSRAVWQWDAAGPAPTAEDRRERIALVAQRTGVDPDALARMAARQITGVLPKAFGVKLVDTSRPNWEHDESAHYVQHLVHADESLPSGARELKAGTVVPNQDSVKIEIFEQAGGEESRELSANKLVDQGEGTIEMPPGLPAGAPIDIEMAIDNDGLLEVRAVEPSTGRELKINVQVSILSAAEVAEATNMVSSIAVRA